MEGTFACRVKLMFEDVSIVWGTGSIVHEYREELSCESEGMSSRFFFSVVFKRPLHRLRYYRRGKTTATPSDGGQTGKTVVQCRLDKRALEVERGEVCLGYRALGKIPSWQVLGCRALGKETPGLGLGKGALAVRLLPCPPSMDREF